MLGPRGVEEYCAVPMELVDHIVIDYSAKLLLALLRGRRAESADDQTDESLPLDCRDT